MVCEAISAAGVLDVFNSSNLVWVLTRSSSSRSNKVGVIVVEVVVVVGSSENFEFHADSFFCCLLSIKLLKSLFAYQLSKFLLIVITN